MLSQRKSEKYEKISKADRIWGRVDIRKRCKSVSRDGNRCIHSARTGCDICVRCQYAERNARAHNKMRYARVLGPSISEAIKQEAISKLDDRDSLYDELTLVRQAATIDIGLWSQAYEAFKKMPNEKTLLLVKSTNEAMQASLARVKEFCLASSKIKNDARQSYSIMDLGVIVEQLVSIVSSALQNATGDDSIILELRERIESELLIPSDNNNKSVGITQQQVEQQYKAMIESVPIVDSDEELQVA